MGLLLWPGNFGRGGAKIKDGPMPKLPARERGTHEGRLAEHVE
jgi:hypothetical protein